MSPTPKVPAGSPFTLQNIPFGVISTDSNPQPRCASAIGNHAVDLALLFENTPTSSALDRPAPFKDFKEVFSQASQPSNSEGEQG